MSETRFVAVWSLRRELKRPLPLTPAENAEVLAGILRDGCGREHGVMVPKLPPEREDEAAIVWNTPYVKKMDVKRERSASVERMMELAKGKKSA